MGWVIEIPYLDREIRKIWFCLVEFQLYYKIIKAYMP